jgi:hypothetical protein
MKVEVDCRDNFDLLSHYVIAPLSTFFNIFVLCIINMKQNRDILPTYRVILQIMCAVDLLNSIYCSLIDLVSFWVVFDRALCSLDFGHCV